MAVDVHHGRCCLPGSAGGEKSKFWVEDHSRRGIEHPEAVTIRPMSLEVFDIIANELSDVVTDKGHPLCANHMLERRRPEAGHLLEVRCSNERPHLGVVTTKY